MIQSLTVDAADVNKTPVGWFGKVFPSGIHCQFTPGLNILWGPNGSGKSTILRLCAKMFHSEQSFEPVVTRDSIRELENRRYDKKKEDAPDLDGAKIVHSGLGVSFFDPSQKVGVIGGAFDDEFFGQGLMNTMFKGSSGQTTMFRFEQTLARALNGKAPSVVWRDRRLLEEPPKGAYDFIVNEHKRAKAIETFLAGDPTIEHAERPTFLLDEPDRSLDLLRQKSIWAMMRAASKHAQLIVAAHSIFALDLPEAAYFKFGTQEAKADLYFDRSVAQRTELATWPERDCSLTKEQKAAAKKALTEIEKAKKKLGD